LAVRLGLTAGIAAAKQDRLALLLALALLAHLGRLRALLARLRGRLHPIAALGKPPTHRALLAVWDQVLLAHLLAQDNLARLLATLGKARLAHLAWVACRGRVLPAWALWQQVSPHLLGQMFHKLKSRGRRVKIAAQQTPLRL
jgi:hypothetical protein